MRRRLLPVIMIFAAACGDGGPDAGEFEGRWRLTDVNVMPLPAAGNTTGGQMWAAAVLQVTGETGFFDRCLRDPSTLTLTSHSTPVVLASISEDRVTVSYSDRRDSPPDTATRDAERLTLRYRNTLTGQLDVLTFLPVEGPIPEACLLVP